MTSTPIRSDAEVPSSFAARAVAGNVVSLRPLRTVPDVATLTAARRAAGLTMTELAARVHVTRPTVGGWERGERRPARYRWAALATALELQEEAVGRLFIAHPPARLDCEPLPSLAAVRRQSGLTQRAVANLVGVAPTTLCMWETANAPVPPASAARLAEVLGTEVAVLAADAAPDLNGDSRPLRQMRRETRMSQIEAAAHLSVAVGSLARYESGERRPPVPVARRMAAAYRRPVDHVLAAAGIRLLPLPTGARWRPEEVPDGILAARTASGLSRDGLGRLVGRSGRVVRGWETGRTRPGPGICRRLEAVLGLPAGRLPS